VSFHSRHPSTSLCLRWRWNASASQSGARDASSSYAACFACALLRSRGWFGSWRICCLHRCVMAGRAASIAVCGRLETSKGSSCNLVRAGESVGVYGKTSKQRKKACFLSAHFVVHCKFLVLCFSSVSSLARRHRRRLPCCTATFHAAQIEMTEYRGQSRQEEFSVHTEQHRNQPFSRSFYHLAIVVWRPRRLLLLGYQV
jgi:hypothetical protein